MAAAHSALTGQQFLGEPARILICHGSISQGSQLKPNLPADQNRLDGLQSASPLLKACLLFPKGNFWDCSVTSRRVEKIRVD